MANPSPRLRRANKAVAPTMCVCMTAAFHLSCCNSVFAQRSSAADDMSRSQMRCLCPRNARPGAVRMHSRHFCPPEPACSDLRILLARQQAQRIQKPADFGGKFSLSDGGWTKMVTHKIGELNSCRALKLLETAFNDMKAACCWYVTGIHWHLKYPKLYLAIVKRYACCAGH